jgi:translation initiation factor 4E
VQKYVVDGGISLNFPVVDTVLWRMAAVEGTEEKHSVEAMAESIPEKHPLQNRWALWYFKSDKNKDWKDNLKLVISFDTVEEFWS